MMIVDETSIRRWADHHECRRSLPVMIRRLIRETTPTLSSMRFPGHEAVDLPGLDGEAYARESTAWVPQGRSVWEMGCDEAPMSKANRDYDKRTGNTPRGEREQSSFVFVTPRRWPSKAKWLENRRKEGAWGKILAYDAIDLETWLEEAPATSQWVRHLLSWTNAGLFTPTEWWQRWASASLPPLSMRLVATRRNDEARVLLKRLHAREPVVSVLADDRTEAVAFVIASLAEAGANDILDRALVVTSGMASIPTHKVNHLIVITDLPEGEEPDFGDRRNMSLVRTYPRGRVGIDNPIALSHVPSDVFRTELEVMGFSESEAEAKALNTGFSIPVLRRSLSPDPEIKQPVWARSRSKARQLLPFALVGSWVEGASFDDSLVIQLLGDFEDDDLARIWSSLIALDDAPVTQVGQINITVSQFDALFALGPYFETQDLDRFFQVAKELLGDRDPALDLPQEKRWMANVLGKGRTYSPGLLSGLGDALCLLAIHGNSICGTRLKDDFNYRAADLVHAILGDADEERWLSVRGYLRTFAEADPAAFLDRLEEELGKPDPPIQAILGVNQDGFQGECLRSQLLWALESLAWFPNHFVRVARLLFELQRFELHDNWANTPESSAQALFCAWFPATLVDPRDKIRVLRELAEVHRLPAIDVCLSLLPRGGHRFASRTAQPRWLVLDKEITEPSIEEVQEAAAEASRLLLDLAPFSIHELSTILAEYKSFHPDYLIRLADSVRLWAKGASDDEKAELRHFFRREEVLFVSQQRGVEPALETFIDQMIRVLEPESITARHRWLFNETHIEWRALVEDEEHKDLSWEDRQARVREKQEQALAEIGTTTTDDGLFQFALSVRHPEVVAQILVPQTSPPDAIIHWLVRTLRHDPTSGCESFLRQVLSTASTTDFDAVQLGLDQKGILDIADNRKRVAQSLPGNTAGWSAVKSMGKVADDAYWRSVNLTIMRDTPREEAKHVVEHLLKYQRPRSAFYAACRTPSKIDAEQWVQLLQSLATIDEPDGNLPDAYNLDVVFTHLEDTSDTPEDRIAELELPFIPLLSCYGHRISNRTLALHRVLAHDPSLFVQLLNWRYAENNLMAPESDGYAREQKGILNHVAYHAFEGWTTVPGMRDDGTLESEAFLQWATDAFQQAASEDLQEGAEREFGKLLARLARYRPWNDWLPAEVLKYLDRPENGGLRSKLELGVQNARGITRRLPFEGGTQEQRLAEKYRSTAAQYEQTYPRVAILLKSIASHFEWDGRRHEDAAIYNERWQP